MHVYVYVSVCVFVLLKSLCNKNGVGLGAGGPDLRFVIVMVHSNRLRFHSCLIQLPSDPSDLQSQSECGVDLAPGAPCTMRSARAVVKLSSSSDARFVITRSELGYAAL